MAGSRAARLASAEACSSSTGAQPAAQFVELRIGALFLGRNPRVANQTAWRGGFRQFCRHEFGSPRDRSIFTNQ